MVWRFGVETWIEDETVHWSWSDVVAEHNVALTVVLLDELCAYIIALSHFCPGGVDCLVTIEYIQINRYDMIQYMTP